MVHHMESDRIEKLTEAQRVCLRMVLMHLSSKDIARELGISPHTVDQRLRMAIQVLGVANRFEAARILARHESQTPYQSAIYQTPHVAPEPIPATVGLSDIHGVRQGNEAFHGTAVREEQIAFRTPAFATGGNFEIRVNGDLIWERKRDGGFPGPKELKQRVRDIVEPGRDLGHVDRASLES